MFFNRFFKGLFFKDFKYFIYFGYSPYLNQLFLNYYLLFQFSKLYCSLEFKKVLSEFKYPWILYYFKSLFFLEFAKLHCIGILVIRTNLSGIKKINIKYRILLTKTRIFNFNRIIFTLNIRFLFTDCQVYFVPFLAIN